MVRVILISLVLMGCASKPVIESYPRAVVPDRPVLAIEEITPSSSDEDLIKAYPLSIKQLQQWGIELETMLKVYQ